MGIESKSMLSYVILGPPREGGRWGKLGGSGGQMHQQVDQSHQIYRYHRHRKQAESNMENLRPDVRLLDLLEAPRPQFMLSTVTGPS